MPVNKYIAQELDTLLKLAQDQVDDIVNRSRDGYGNKKSSGLEDAIFELSGVSNGFHSSQEEGVAELQELMSGLPRIGNWIMRNLKKVGNQIDLPQLIQSETSKKSGVTEAGRPDVMRHQGDTTVRVVKRGGKPIGEIGTDAEASSGNGSYYVKLYDGSYDAVGFDSAEEALAELKAAISEGITEANRGFRGVGGAREREDDERHDLDPSDWYIVKDGKLLKASIYPNQHAQARAEGFSPTREQARARASNKGVAESVDPIEQLRADIRRFAQ